MTPSISPWNPSSPLASCTHMSLQSKFRYSHRLQITLYPNALPKLVFQLARAATLSSKLGFERALGNFLHDNASMPAQREELEHGKRMNISACVAQVRSGTARHTFLTPNSSPSLARSPMTPRKFLCIIQYRDRCQLGSSMRQVNLDEKEERLLATFCMDAV